VKFLLGFGKEQREISPLQGIRDSSAKGREALSNTLSRPLP